ncbi:MAG TPA: four helix bundle protein [Candidatus Acidoferrum sp.]|jgi:four helix bundle protein|nr:four helix bundle protein [Candidatus Acidoferrum sp.]
MNNIGRFEDIIAWQRARTLTKEIYASTKAGQFARDYGLKDQIQRASVSTMANIAEGYERDGDKEFLQFLSNSKGSCGEVRSHLYVALDQGYLTQTSFSSLFDQAAEVSRLLSGFMNYLRQSNVRGRKYRSVV